MYDVVVRGGLLITPEGHLFSDLGIEDGSISAIETGLSPGKTEIDATGLTVFPGVVDAHVHFNEPGRTEWEGIASGSQAFAAGGGTLFADMPLNSSPCTLDAASFDLKKDAMEKSSVTDFSLWGGLVPENLEKLDELAARGVMGFKAFLSDSGLTEFSRTDDLTLYEGMKIAARLGLPVGVHAESEELTSKLTKRIRGEGRHGISDYLQSRPVIAELEAIQKAALFAKETGAKLHIVHVSSGRGVVLAAEARALGADISIETCPHYLFFTEEDLERLGAVGKCAPPLRAPHDQEQLWAALLSGDVDTIGSDHSPSSPDLKQGDDFFSIWGGIAGVQSTLPAMLEAGWNQRKISLQRISELTAGNPAKRFGFTAKGRIEVGLDADLVLVDCEKSFLLQREDLLTRHPLSPYLGSTFRGVVRRTILRGETIFAEGHISHDVRGKFVRPELE